MAAVVEAAVAVSVEVTALAPVIVTVEFEKLRVGLYCAPEGLAVIAAVSATAPMKPPTGVTVMEVVPELPLETVIVLPERVKEPVGGCVTVTDAAPVAKLKVEVLELSGV